MENCWENVPHSSQDYYPHYNLFQSSIFYDTDNFRKSYKYDECLPSESSEIEEKAEPPDKPPEAEAPPVKEKRVVSRDELYQDPDLFKSKNCEIMMQKMGWQGLSKSGNGILRSISPEHVNAFRSSVFGQHPPQQPSRVPRAAAGDVGEGETGGGASGEVAGAGKAAKKTGPKKDFFRTNMLLHILDFVRDDTETELLFDSSLRQHERRNIINIVQSVVNDQAVFALGSVAQYDLALNIHKYSAYVLDTACHTEGETRQICIYKEAPDDVYLVTPDDFLPKDDVTETSSQPEANGMDDDENPFLKSIKKSIRKEEKEDDVTNKFEGCSIAKENGPVPAEEKIVEFFLEFAEGAYKEMRFLGTFTDDQITAINHLLHDVGCGPAAELSPGAAVLSPGAADLTRLLRDGTFRLREGVNGTTEVYKDSTASVDKN